MRVLSRLSTMKDRRLLAIALGLAAFLLIALLVMIVRHERLRSRFEAAAHPAVPALVKVELRPIQRFAREWRRFGSTLQVFGTEPLPGRQDVWVTRGRFVENLPGFEGGSPITGVDVFTSTDADRVDADEEKNAFPVAEHPALYPMVRWKDGSPKMLWKAIRTGRSVMVFYAHPSDEESIYLADEFERFLAVTPKEMDAFMRRVADLHERRLEQFKALTAIQEALSRVDIYQGDVDGIFGWRTKRALQKFLKSEGCYGSRIDGVFGRESQRALAQFRSREGLPESEQTLDAGLARAVVAKVESRSGEDATQSVANQDPAD